MASKILHKRSFVQIPTPSYSGKLIGYARVSKGDEQNNILQTSALREAGCSQLFYEAASGGKWDRPELHRMLNELREGDIVVVWKLDRLSRSLKDVLQLMEQITAARAEFRSLTESLDTTTPAGRMLMQVVGSFAEFERALIRERTSAGLAAARANGRIGGRRPIVEPARQIEIAEAILSNLSTGTEMAKANNVSQATISRIVASYLLRATAKR